MFAIKTNFFLVNITHNSDATLNIIGIFRNSFFFSSADNAREQLEIFRNGNWFWYLRCFTSGIAIISQFNQNEEKRKEINFKSFHNLTLFLFVPSPQMHCTQSRFRFYFFFFFLLLCTYDFQCQCPLAIYIYIYIHIYITTCAIAREILLFFFVIRKKEFEFGASFFIVACYLEEQFLEIFQ